TYSAPGESALTGGRRFAPASAANGGDGGGEGHDQPASDNPLPGILPDIPHHQGAPIQQQAPQQQPQQAPGAPPADNF
ncbi:MAG TPA: hypothetical protein V6C72_05105, partial [Chroococcales cyanobacterium]